MPVAVYCWVAPMAMVAVVGVTAMETSVAGGVMVNVAVPVAPESAAVTVPEPAATPVARPPAAMVAIAVLLTDQVTEDVMFAVLLSL